MESHITTKEFLHVDRLSYSYHTLAGETTALKEVSFHVSEGQFLAIVGPSGCGNAM
jgi:NitT/TauT family transport system ATP-binding protein